MEEFKYSIKWKISQRNNEPKWAKIALEYRKKGAKLIVDSKEWWKQNGIHCLYTSIWYFYFHSSSKNLFYVFYFYFDWGNSVFLCRKLHDKRCENIFEFISADEKKKLLRWNAKHFHHCCLNIFRFIWFFVDVLHYLSILMESYYFTFFYLSRKISYLLFSSEYNEHVAGFSITPKWMRKI